eukprot:1157624-Pelagomonas_calceolata.AAC.17
MQPAEMVAAAVKVHTSMAEPSMCTQSRDADSITFGCLALMPHILCMWHIYREPDGPENAFPIASLTRPLCEHKCSIFAPSSALHHTTNNNEEHGALETHAL